jgi:hypothetical protein
MYAVSPNAAFPWNVERLGVSNGTGVTGDRFRDICREDSSSQPDVAVIGHAEEYHAGGPWAWVEQVPLVELPEAEARESCQRESGL